MKTIFRIFGAGALLALAAPFSLNAQNEPLIAVEFTDIAVLNTADHVVDVMVTSGGSGYTSKPTVTVTGGGGTGTVLDATIRDGKVAFISILAAGGGYATKPVITISPPGVAATANATASASGTTTGGPLASISLASGGSGYATA